MPPAKETLRKIVLKNNLLKSIPSSYLKFYEFLQTKMYAEALDIIHELGEINECICNLIDHEHINDFALPLVKRTTNELDLSFLLGAVVCKIIPKNLWLERINLIGFETLEDFLKGKEFPYFLFKKYSLCVLFKEMSQDIPFYAVLFREELISIVEYDELENNLPFASSFHNFCKLLTTDEREFFYPIFLNGLPRIPEVFKETKYMIKYHLER